MDQGTSEQRDRFSEHLAHVRKNHPDHIGIFFTKHLQAPKSLKSPTQPFILFKKDCRIKQAMITLHSQIKQNNLYFFCLAKVTDKDGKPVKVRYVKIKPEQTVGQLFNRFGDQQILTLIYGNNQMGLQSLQKYQKCLVITAVVLVILWALLHSLPYVLQYLHSNDTQDL